MHIALCVAGGIGVFNLLAGVYFVVFHLIDERRKQRVSDCLARLEVIS